jgi:hypothetical protein
VSKRMWIRMVIRQVNMFPFFLSLLIDPVFWYLSSIVFNSCISFVRHRSTKTMWWSCCPLTKYAMQMEASRW